jgi:hypothetical protein
MCTSPTLTIYVHAFYVRTTTTKISPITLTLPDVKKGIPDTLHLQSDLQTYDCTVVTIHNQLATTSDTLK